MSPPTPSNSSSATWIRTLVLIGLLGLTLAGLWYDRKVARPAVETAFETIEKLADKMNVSENLQGVTEKEVQAALHRTPSQTFQEGPYYIEAYGFASGLPFRTYKYYAIYSAGEEPGKPHRFLTHSTFDLPRSELFPQATKPMASTAPMLEVPKWNPETDKPLPDDSAK